MERKKNKQWRKITHSIIVLIIILATATFPPHVLSASTINISELTITGSNPLDTDPSFGWINITCKVTDNRPINNVYLNITTPDETWNNVTMNKIGSSDYYYYKTNTLFTQIGTNSYMVYAKDTDNNDVSSHRYNFSMPPNWDINHDGACTLIDLIQISNHYGETGAAGWIREDVDNNGQIQIADLLLASNHYSESWGVREMAQLKKLSICYTTTINNQTNQHFLADHFDMVDCGKSVATAANQIKSLNPNIKIIGYYDSIIMQPYYADWNYVNQYEEWFVHDKNGNRIVPADLNGYLMNPAPNLTPNAPYHSWSDYYAQKSNQFLQNHTQYDGIFADEVPLNLQEAGYSWNVPYSNFPQVILDNWGIWMVQHIQNLQTTIGNKMVFPNAWKYTQFCENITGIHVWEDFIHGKVHDITEPGYGEYYTLYTINKLHEQAVKGNTLAVISGTKRADSNPVLAHQYMLFTLVCFLFTVEDMQKSYYAWNFFGDDASNGYYPEMDFRFGNPIGEYYNVQGSVYARNFENATVVANISPSTSYTVVINGNAYFIGSRIGMILET